MKFIALITAGVLLGLSCSGSQSGDGAAAASEQQDGSIAPPAVQPPSSVPSGKTPDAVGSLLPMTADAAPVVASPDATATDVRPVPAAADAVMNPAGNGRATPMPSVGCNQKMAPPDGLQMIMAGGKARDYYIHVPKGYDPARAYPLFFAFHGASRSGKDFEGTGPGTFAFRMVMGGDAILVFPNALPDATGTTAWVGGDVPFFDALVDQFKTALCVDTARIFVAGHSSGGFFSNLLGCQRGDVIRGFAPVEGGVSGPTNACKGNPAAFIVHGRVDMIVSIMTGIRSRDFWVTRNGCQVMDPAATMPAPCVAYRGCKTGAPVDWCQHEETAYSGTGHGWPTFATRGLWAFFSAL